MVVVVWPGKSAMAHIGPSWPLSSWIHCPFFQTRPVQSQDPDTSTPSPKARHDTVKFFIHIILHIQTFFTLPRPTAIYNNYTVWLIC